MFVIKLIFKERK